MLLCSLLASEFIRVAASRRILPLAVCSLSFTPLDRELKVSQSGSSIFLAMVDVNAGSAAALELALLDVRQLNSYARRVIVQQRPFATFADMAKRVNAGLPPTSCNRLTAKLAKHFRFDDGGARERNAEYGRELVGLNIRIPWSAWDGYPDGSGFETGTVFEYQSKHRPGRFVIAFPTAEEIDDISLSWEELLGETPCLASDAERVQLIWRDCASLTRQPAGRPAMCLAVVYAVPSVRITKTVR